MLDAVWFDAGDRRPGRLLLVAHHLVVDWVSWSILTADLAQAWDAVRAGRSPSLPCSGTSFRRWTELLAAEACSPARIRELPLWTRILADAGAAVTGGALDPARDVVKTLRHAELVVPAERAEPLLTALPSAYYTGVPEVLLTGLAVAVATRPDAGSGGAGPGRALLVGLEGHGREEQVAGGVDLSATVGWFTTYFPVRLDLGPVDPVQAQRGGPAIGAALKRVKEQVRAVPDSGLGYGLLRYLNPDTCGALAALPEPALAFNYLGRFRAPSGQPWELAGQTATFRLPPQDDRAVRVGLDVNAMVLDGAHGPDLHITVDWPDALIPRATVEDLLARWDQALRGLSEHADEPSAGGHTPSDHPLVPLTQEDLDEFEGHVE